MYIKRHLETTIEKLSGCCKVLLVTGPRQVGKTTLLRRLAEGNRTYVTMDDGRYQRAQLGNDGTGAVSAAV